MRPYWFTLFYAFLIVFVSIGLARFSFGMILPNLQEDLSISTTLSGLISTSNFIGYFVGIFFVSTLYNRYETSNMLFVIVLLQALSMFCMAFSNDHITASLFYAFTGFFSAISNVAIMVYIAHVIPQHLRGKALGLVVTGIGFAIISTGLYIPFMESAFETASWRASWLSFATITLAVAFVVKYGIKADTHKEHKNKQAFYHVLYERNFWKISLMYVIFGITYVVYVTYFVFASMEKYDLQITQSGYFWSLLGLMSLISGPIFGSLADKIGAYKTLIIVYALLCIANFILASDLPAFMLTFSAITFGISAWSIPSLITLLTSIHFGKEKTAQVFSMITIIFAGGQTIGPVLSGYIYDHIHSFDTVFLMCGIICFIGLVSASVFSRTSH